MVEGESFGGFNRDLEMVCLVHLVFFGGLVGLFGFVWKIVIFFGLIACLYEAV